MNVFLVDTCALHAMNLMIATPCEKFFGSGGIGQRTPMQLLCTCFALQKEHEMVEFRAMWNSCNNMPCGQKFQEPVHARWEHIGVAATQFLDRIEGFCNVAEGVIKAEKSYSQRNKVASELCSLTKESALITMIYFLVACHKCFWFPNF